MGGLRSAGRAGRAADAGRSVRIEGTPERIVALAPNLTEIVFSVGAGGALVGVSDFSDYPAEAQEIPKVGGFPLNIELIVSLEPHLILAAGITSLEDVAQLEALGMTVLYLNPTDLEVVLESVRTVGEVVGRSQEAEDLVAGLQDRLDAIRDRAASVETRPRVYYEIDPTLYSGGPGSFTHELIVLAGGADNEFGHPAPSTLERLEGITTLRTDQRGTIEVITDGERLWVVTER